MAQSINLIPQEEKKAQVKVQIVKASTVIAVLLLIIVSIIAAYFYYQITDLKNQVKVRTNNIARLRADINALAEMEVIARNLDKKYMVLDEMLNTRPHYSVLLDEVKMRIPEAVTIDDFSLRNKGELNFSGLGENYISISKFLTNLGEPAPERATEGLENLFTKVILKSVTLDSKTNGAKYFIIAEFNNSLLNR